MAHHQHAAMMLATARLCERLAEALPNARNHLLEEIRRIDGTLRAHAYDNDTSGPATIDTGQPCPQHGRTSCAPCHHNDPDPLPVTQVEAVVHRRAELFEDLEYLEGMGKAVAHYTHLLLGECERLTGKRTRAPRCDPAGREGADVPRHEGGWADYTCTGIPDPQGGPLCPRCRRREHRWRTDNGLPARIAS